jgi:hypothetical protein
MISRSKMSNALTDCLRRLEAGSTLDQVLADYPYLADQLRELLSTAQVAQLSGKTARIPASAQIDSRRRMLAQAQALKNRDKNNLFLPLFRFLSHNTGTILVGLTAFALLFIALGSTRALPGDSLYPVKIGAEQAGSSLYSGASSQTQREENFDSRRIAEINQMIIEKRTGSVQFGGFLDYSKVAGWQVAGISLGIPPSVEKQSQSLLGAYVDITGSLDTKGVVMVQMLNPRLDTIRGTLTSIQGAVWQIGASSVLVGESTSISGAPHIGSLVVVQGSPMRGSPQVLAFSVKVDNSTNLGTNEPIDNTATPQPTITETLPSARIPTRTPASITPQPQDDTHPRDPQPTKEHENEDDANRKGREDTQRED